MIRQVLLSMIMRSVCTNAQILLTQLLPNAWTKETGPRDVQCPLTRALLEAASWVSMRASGDTPLMVVPRHNKRRHIAASLETLAKYQRMKIKESVA